MRIGFEWNKMEINLVTILIFLNDIQMPLQCFPRILHHYWKYVKKVEINHLNAEMTNIKY